MSKKRFDLRVTKIVSSGQNDNGNNVCMLVEDHKGDEVLILVPHDLQDHFKRAWRGAIATAAEARHHTIEAELKSSDQVAKATSEQSSGPESLEPKPARSVPSQGANDMTIVSPTFDLTRVGGPVTSVPLPEKFFPFLGHIITLWGLVESHLDHLLNGLCKASDSDTPLPRYFDKKLKKWRALTEQLFAGAPSIKNEFLQLADSMENLGADRNLIAHGNLICSSLGGGTLIARNEYRGKQVEKSFSFEQIEQLFLDLSSLAGRLFFIQILVGKEQFFFPAPEEEQEFFIEFCRAHLTIVKPSND